MEKAREEYRIPPGFAQCDYRRRMRWNPRGEIDGDKSDSREGSHFLLTPWIHHPTWHFASYGSG